MDTVGVGSPYVAGGEDGGPEDNNSRLYHIHIRTYWMCVVCACYCLQNMLIGPMYVYGLKVPAALFVCMYFMWTLPILCLLLREQCKISVDKVQ